MSELKFSTKTKSLAVVIEDLEGKQCPHELREMTAAVRDRYMDELGARILSDPSGKPIGVKKFEGMFAALLSRCLVGINEDGTVRSIPVAEIQEWPSSAVQQLYEAAQKINGLETKPDDAKNA